MQFVVFGVRNFLDVYVRRIYSGTGYIPYNCVGNSCSIILINQSRINIIYIREIGETMKKPKYLRQSYETVKSNNNQPRATTDARVRFIYVIYILCCKAISVDTA